MPISAAQSDAPKPHPRRKGRVELLAADPTSEANDDSSTDRRSINRDGGRHPRFSNGGGGDWCQWQPRRRRERPSDFGGRSSGSGSTNGDVFALDELLEDFPEPPADVMRQAADPSSVTTVSASMDRQRPISSFTMTGSAAQSWRREARPRLKTPAAPASTTGQDVSAGDRPGLAPDR